MRSSSTLAFAITSAVGKVPEAPYLTVAGGEASKLSFSGAAKRGMGERKRFGWLDGGGVILEDGGGGDLKAAELSRDCVSTMVDIPFALDWGVEGIWMSEEPMESESGSALAMGAQEAGRSRTMRPY